MVVIMEMIMMENIETSGGSETNVVDTEILLPLAGNHVVIDIRISLMITRLGLCRQCQNRLCALMLKTIVPLFRLLTTENLAVSGIQTSLMIIRLVDLFRRRHQDVVNLMTDANILVPSNILVQAIIVEMIGTTTSTILGQQARCRRQPHAMIVIIHMMMIAIIQTIETMSDLDLVTGMTIGVIAEVKTSVICTMSQGLYRNQREARRMMTTAIAHLMTGALIGVTRTKRQDRYRNQHETRDTTMIAGAAPMSMKGICHQGHRLHKMTREGGTLENAIVLPRPLITVNQEEIGRLADTVTTQPQQDRQHLSLE